jgi:iron complex transport system substrate-binding protein
MVSGSFSSSLHLLLLWAAAVSLARGNLTDGECVPDGEYDPQVDYFPHKAVPRYAQRFSVEYFNSYKLVTVDNEFSSQSYALYQCGTPQPDLREGVKYIAVPVTSVAVASTTYLSRIQQLDSMEAITALDTDPSLVADDCLNSLLESGNTVVSTTYNDTCFSDITDNEVLEAQGIAAAFVSSDSVGFSAPCDAPVYNAVLVYDIYEADNDEDRDVNLKLADWSLFFSYFFNKEGKANSDREVLQARWDCTSQNAMQCSGVIAPEPLVGWIPGFWDVTGWYMPETQSYYSEMIESAGGKMAQCDPGSVVSSFGYEYMTDDEMLQCLADADVCIFAQPIEDLPANVLAELPCVQQGRYYDVQRAGLNYWFENYQVTPDVLLQDVIKALFPEEVAFGIDLHRRVFLRDISAGESIGEMDEGTCDDPLVARPPRAQECVDVVPLCTDGSDGDEAHVRASSSIVAASLMALVAVVLA